MKTSSSTISIGVATAFLLLATLVGFLADDKVAIGAAAWSLRGTLAPGFDQPVGKGA